MTTTEDRARSATPYTLRVSIALLAIGFVVTVLDVLFAKGVFDIMVNENELVSWLLALGIAGAAALSAVSAGIAAAEGNVRWAKIALCAWAFIGLAMATVRCFKGVIESNGLNPTDVVLSLVMIGIHLAGITLYMHAKDAWSRERLELAAAKRQLERANRKVRQSEAKYTRVQHEVAEVDNTRTRVAHELRSTLDTIDGMQRQLHAVARDRLVLRLADPTQSSLFRSDLEGGEELPGGHATHRESAASQAESDRYIDLDQPTTDARERR